MKQFRVTLARNTAFGDEMHLAGNFEAESPEGAGEAARQAFLTALSESVRDAKQIGVDPEYARNREVYEQCFLRIVKVEEL